MNAEASRDIAHYSGYPTRERYRRWRCARGVEHAPGVVDLPVFDEKMRAERASTIVPATGPANHRHDRGRDSAKQRAVRTYPLRTMPTCRPHVANGSRQILPARLTGGCMQYPEWPR